MNDCGIEIIILNPLKEESLTFHHCVTTQYALSVV